MTYFSFDSRTYIFAEAIKQDCSPAQKRKCNFFSSIFRILVIFFSTLEKYFDWSKNYEKYKKLHLLSKLIIWKHKAWIFWLKHLFFLSLSLQTVSLWFSHVSDKVLLDWGKKLETVWDNLEMRKPKHWVLWNMSGTWVKGAWNEITFVRTVGIWRDLKSSTSACKLVVDYESNILYLVHVRTCNTEKEKIQKLIYRR